MKPILKTYSRQKKHCSLYDTEYNFLKEDALLCCRGCLATDRRLFNIHDHNLADALAHITGTPVFKDELPQHLCSYCCRLLLKCESFRDMCLHTQWSLTTELLKGSLNLDCIREINRPNNHYIDLLSISQFVSVSEGVYLADLNVNLKDEPETVEGIGDVKKELETAAVGISMVDDDIEEIPEMKFITNVDIVDEPATVPGIDGHINKGIEEILETVVGTDGTINDDIEDEAATVRGIDDAINYDIGEKLATDEDTDGMINDDIVGELDRIINKTDSKAEFETQTRLLNNISVDKLKYTQNIENALKIQKEMVITNVNDERVKAEEQLKRLLTRKQTKIKNTDGVNTSKNDDKPTKLRKVRRRTEDKRKLRKADDDMPDFDFTKFETANAVKIVILSRARKNAHLECKSCEVTFVSTHALDKHKMAAGEEHTKMFPCVQCGDNFDSVDAMKIHDDEEHPKCEDCNLKFLNAFSFDTHVDRKHRGISDPPTKTQKEANILAKELGLPLPYPAPRPEQSGLSISVCGHCGKIFKKPCFLVYHLRKLCGKKLKYACPYCPKSYDIRDLYKTHLRVHTGEKPFKCDHCGVAFTSKGNLQQHILNMHLRVHTREKTFKCDHCGMAFTWKSSLQRHVVNMHLRVHTGEKPFKCDHCGMAFTWKASLQRHMLNRHLRVHTGGKPFKCDHCGVAFTSKSSLQRHMLNVHLGINKKYACDICGRVFTTPSSVKLHVRTVHNGEPWPRRVKRKKLK